MLTGMNDDALAYLSIVRLQHAYGDIATRQAWAELSGLVIPDARFSFDLRMGSPIELSGAEALGTFGARSVGGFSFYQYIPLNAVVSDVRDDSARGRAYALEVAEDRASGEWLEIYGLYDDDYRGIEGSWRFASRRFQILGRRTGSRMEAFRPDAESPGDIR
jgi:hypothetical protein